MFTFATLLILLFSITYYTQSKIIGKVIDEEFNETMLFANVLIKGTSQGVTTDFDGNYIYWKYNLELIPLFFHL